MSRGYIYNQNGKIEEELEYSVEGDAELWCPHCRKITYQSLVAISSTRGYVYACSECGCETS